MTDAMQRAVYWLDCVIACEPDITAQECSSRLLAYARRPRVDVPLCEPHWSQYVEYTHGQHMLATLGDRLDLEYERAKWDHLMARA